MEPERRRIFVTDVPQVAPRSQGPLRLSGPLIRGDDGQALFVLNREPRTLDGLNSRFEPATHIDLTHQLTAHMPAYERIQVLSGPLVVVLGLDFVACVDSGGREKWRFQHPSWPRFVGGDALMVAESLVVVIPARAAPTGYSQVPDARLVILDPSSGVKGKQLELSAEQDSPEGFHAVSRSDHLGGAIDAGYGQDGSEIWRVALGNDGRIGVRRMSTIDRVLADISPSGGEILTTPHDSQHLSIYSWRDLKEIASLAREDVFALESDGNNYTADNFGFYAWYVGNDRILALTRQGRLLLIDRGPIKVLHQLVIEGFNDEITDVTVLDSARLVVRSRDGRARLCEL
jgi:hypothetical protein